MATLMVPNGHVPTMPYMEEETALLVPYGTCANGHQLYDRNTDLEYLLNNIYNTKLHFRSDHPEVLFLRKGMEAIVSKIVVELNKFKDSIFKAFCNTEPEIFSKLVDVTGENLWKLGSFYEGTKNSYPDEFDYVYVPFRLSKSNLTWKPRFELCDAAFRRSISNLANAGSLMYTEKDVGDVFFEDYDGTGNVCSQLRFTFIRNSECYKRGKQLKRSIRVNLIPGILVTDPKMAERIEQLCPIPKFRQTVMDTMHGRYILFPGCFVAFSEAEVYFMNHVLSRKHSKVYRILKYIVNGNKTGEELGELCKNSKHQIMCSLPSYAIKTAVMHHHYECKDESQDMGGCVLAVLHMLNQSYNNPQPRFGEDAGCLYVDMATPANEVFTLAYGDDEFIEASQTCISNMTRFLRHYSKTNEEDLIIDTLATRMTTSVVQYNATHTSLLRRYQAEIFGSFGLDAIGKCCYTLAILFTVLGFIGVMIHIHT